MDGFTAFKSHNKANSADARIPVRQPDAIHSLAEIT